MRFEERLAFGGGDFGDPATENGLLDGLGIGETDAHPHARMNVDDLGRRFEDAVVAGNFDDDFGTDGDRIEEIEIAAADAKVGDARFDFRAGSDDTHAGFGHHWIARIASTFAAAGDWRLLPTGPVEWIGRHGRARTRVTHRNHPWQSKQAQ